MSSLLATTIQPNPDVAMQPGARILALDGWRGIAILLVLFDHIQVALSGQLHYAHPWMQTGQHGVTIFFVLSGFLITSKLLAGPIASQAFLSQTLLSPDASRMDIPRGPVAVEPVDGRNLHITAGGQGLPVFLSQHGRCPRTGASSDTSGRCRSKSSSISHGRAFCFSLGRSDAFG